MGQVAKRASVLKRRKSKNKMDSSSSSTVTECNNTASAVAHRTTNAGVSVTTNNPNAARRGSEGDLVFYVEEPRAGKYFNILNIFLIIFIIFNINDVKQWKNFSIFYNSKYLFINNFILFILRNFLIS